MNTANMASFVFFLACFMLFSASINGSVSAERVFKVGGELGWREPGRNGPKFYTHWAEKNRFHVGDSLLFEYQNDSVVEVEKWGYYHCNTTGSIAYFTNGNSSIKLEKSGLFFFISGAPTHCRNGQRLIVDVMGLHHHPSNSPPPLMANSPESGGSDLAPSPQSPVKKNSASSVVSGFWVGVLSVVVAFVGSG